MDLNKLSEEYHDSWIKKQGEVTQFNNGCMVGFRDGFLAATQWHPMDSAVREDGNCILIAYKYSRTGEILVTECFYDSAEGDFCWDRYQTVKNPIAWTHLPIYKPENQ